MVDACLVPTATMSWGEIFYCIGLLTFGDIMFASIVFFLILSYLMWKMGVPIQAALPFMVLILFVLGSANFAADPSFTTLMWLVIIGVAVVFALMILNLARR